MICHIHTREQEEALRAMGIETYASYAEVGVLMGRTEGAIRQWVRDNEFLAPEIMPNGKAGFAMSAVRAWIAAHGKKLPGSNALNAALAVGAEAA